MSDKRADSAASSSDDRQRRIEEIADAYLRKLRRGGVAAWREIAEQHPNLAPELARRLDFIQSVYLALQPDSDSDRSGTSGPAELTFSSDKTSQAPESQVEIPPERVRHIRCPHCGNPINVVSQNQAEVTCANCGSSVTIDPNQTRTDVWSQKTRVIGHFKIVSQLGQGAFGTAYKALDTKLDRLVAIKIPRAGSFATPNDEFRFVREARNAAGLRHPDIVQVYSIENDDGLPYLVCELIDGISLSDLIGGRKLPLRETGEMMVKIADAVQFAHEHNVIHRDLKPSNILLDERQHPHVADFGLARHIEGDFTITLEGEVLGTPAYMSPEQASGKPVDVRTDVYSLGVMLYRLVCGELPFRGSQRMMLHQVLFDDPRPPRKLDDHIPRDLDTIILKAMAKERERRYATAREFADDLRHWLASEPIAARPVGLIGKATRWCHRHPIGALVAAGIATLLLAIAGISLGWGYRERILRGEAQRHKKTAEQRLVQVHNQNGVQQLLAGDLFGSLSWFTRGLALDSEHERLQRLRLGMIGRSLPLLRQLWSPGGEIRTLEFSADGNSLLCASANGSIQLFDVDGDQSSVLQALCDSKVQRADFDSTGTRICSADLSDRASLWDARSRTHVAFLNHDARVWTANFSPDGNWVATAGFDHQAGVWNAKTGELVTKLQHPLERVGLVKFTPDSQYLLTASLDTPGHPFELRLWNFSKGELQIPVMNHPAQILDAIFDRIGERIYTVCGDGSIWVWNAQTGKSIGEPIQQEHANQHIFLVDDGKTLITGSATGTAAFWSTDPFSRKDISVRAIHPILDMAVDTNSNFVAAAHQDNCARVYWLYCGRPVGTDIPHGGQPRIVAFHPDGRRLAVGGSDGVVRLWDLAGLAPTHPVLRIQEDISSLVYNKDGTRLLLGGRDGVARQIDVRTNRLFGAEMRHDDDVVYCEYSPDGHSIVTASADRTAQIWDAESGSAVGPPMPHASPVLRAKFLPGSDQLITTSSDGSGYLWKTGLDQPRHRFEQDKQLVKLAIHPSGEWFAVAGEQPNVRIRKAKDGSQVGEPIEHSDTVSALEFSPSGDRLLSASVSGSVKLSAFPESADGVIPWQLQDGTIDAIFAGADSRVLTGDFSGNFTCWQWDASKANSRWTFTHAAARLGRISMHPDSHIAAVSARYVSDETILPSAGAVFLHDLDSGMLLSPPCSHFQQTGPLAFSPDGTSLASGSRDGTIRIWDLAIDDRPTEDLRVIADLLNGFGLNNSFQHEPMDATAQYSEYIRLSQKYPTAFRCSPAQIDRWNEQVQWVRDARNRPPQ